MATASKPSRPVRQRSPEPIDQFAEPGTFGVVVSADNYARLAEQPKSSTTTSSPR